MKKNKIVHIHTDQKFIYNSLIFENENIHNDIFLVVKDIGFNKTEGDKDITILKDNENNLKKIINFCSNGIDLVVLYNLDLIKSKIALNLPANVKIAWRFFGVELYSLHKFKFISKQSLNEGLTFIHRLRLKMKNKFLIDLIYRFFKDKDNYKRKFLKAVERIDLILMVSEEEYNFLNKELLKLPPLIKLPHLINETIEDSHDGVLKFLEAKKINTNNSVVIGNSRAIYNNHLDVIDMIDQYNNNNDNKFIVLFNYGTLDYYANKVLEKLSNKTYYQVINDFIPKNEFIDFYKKPSSMVINSYRQLAWDNIRLALCNGVKVYMNERNIHKKFLTNNGFKIFSLNDFKNDLKNNNLNFDFELSVHNMKTFQVFSKSYTKDDFQNRLAQTLKNFSK